MLRWVEQHWALLVIFMITLYVGWGAVSALLSAWLQFKQTPTEPMFWCHKHGFFRKKHTLQLFPDLGGTAQNASVCPTCYKEAVWDNPDKKLKG